MYSKYTFPKHRNIDSSQNHFYSKCYPLFRPRASIISLDGPFLINRLFPSLWCWHVYIYISYGYTHCVSNLLLHPPNLLMKKFYILLHKFQLNKYKSHIESGNFWWKVQLLPVVSRSTSQGKLGKWGPFSKGTAASEYPKLQRSKNDEWAWAPNNMDTILDESSAAVLESDLDNNKDIINIDSMCSVARQLDNVCKVICPFPKMWRIGDRM